MSVSVDGFIADFEGAFGWAAPSEELFRVHLAQVRELGGYLCGRRLYETMLVCEKGPSLRDNELRPRWPNCGARIRRSSSAEARQRPGERPARRGISGRRGGCGARHDRQ